MIESLFKELISFTSEKPDESENTSDPLLPDESESSILSALPVIQKIVRHKVTFSESSDSSDLIQGIVLRLWNWHQKFREKSEKMSPDEWQSFAARATYNEINRHFSSKHNKFVPIETIAEIPSLESIAGESDFETRSLVRFVWQEICKLTLRQRRALLLSNHKLVVSLIHNGISEHDLINFLELADETWEQIKDELPLSDSQITEFCAGGNSGFKSNIQSIKKARYEARVKLKKVISE